MDTTYTQVTQAGSQLVHGSVIGETRWTLYVNRREWVTFMCSPLQLHYLALGFLRSENIINSLEDVAWLRVYEAPDRVYWYCPEFGYNGLLTIRTCEEAVGAIDVRLTNRDIKLPAIRTLTSGCGGGITFQDLTTSAGPVDSTRQVTFGQLVTQLEALQESAHLYQQSRGVHTSALSDGNRLLLYAEDVGRHNTLDKIYGGTLMEHIDPTGQILLSTGRVSSEMLAKAAKMGVPIVVSRTSPTSLSVRLAQEWRITLVGYARSRAMNVYTFPERILPGGQVPEAILSRTKHKDA
ncbi:MAG: formate dehydrogenase accessory sulfurtransferase FdhD [Chloroflexi bacterium]|nr:formate dehydrogenase accessory sulfurtransferase FdhD [Chloroflexota bacterium]